jgi:hypothetical protein
MRAPPAGDTKRLQELEVQLRGSCSVPSGFAFLNLPGFAAAPQQQQQQQHANEHEAQQQALHAQQQQQQQGGWALPFAAAGGTHIALQQCCMCEPPIVLSRSSSCGAAPLFALLQQPSLAWHSPHRGAPLLVARWPLAGPAAAARQAALLVLAALAATLCLGPHTTRQQQQQERGTATMKWATRWNPRVCSRCQEQALGGCVRVHQAGRRLQPPHPEAPRGRQPGPSCGCGSRCCDSMRLLPSCATCSWLRLLVFSCVYHYA